MTSSAEADGPARVAVVVKGYPRLSETFIAQEILALQRHGVALEIWALRHPTDRAIHPMNRAITARVRYLPEYLYQEPWRVLKGALHAVTQPGFAKLIRTFLNDVQRDFTANRGRRLGQAFVFGRELEPTLRHLHVHYLHTPCSVVRYAAMLSGRSFSFSAHAKDIWTTPDWEKREKIADCAWGVTCTHDGLAELKRLSPTEDKGRVSLVYHGLDLSRFPEPPASRPTRDGTRADEPVVLLSVGRAVAKKGYDDLLTALARLPRSLQWRFVHIGSGELRETLKASAASLGLADRIEWRGGQAQDAVISAMRDSDLFVLPCKEGDSGDRDGLPNVLMEAATQALPIVSTNFAGVPEFMSDGREGLLVPPADPAALATALERLIREPDLRTQLGRAARRRVVEGFSFEAGVSQVLSRLSRSADLPTPDAERNRRIAAAAE